MRRFGLRWRGHDCGYETWRTLSKVIRRRFAVLAKDECMVQNKILDASVISQSELDRVCGGSGSDRIKLVGNRSSLEPCPDNVASSAVHRKRKERILRPMNTYATD